MPYHQPDRIRYFSFDLFEDAPLTQAAFTRVGGVSTGQWAETNLAITVGDDYENVAQNRTLCFETMGRGINSLSDSWLVHGTAVLVHDAPPPSLKSERIKADIILTDKPDVTLFMRYADCVPLLFYDPVKKAIGLSHAGWMGTTVFFRSG